MDCPRINSSNLAALALVIDRRAAGPMVVFHYPPHVSGAASPAAGPYDPSVGSATQHGRADTPLDLGDIILERMSGGSGSGQEQRGRGDSHGAHHPFQRAAKGMMDGHAATAATAAGGQPSQLPNHGHNASDDSSGAGPSGCAPWDHLVGFPAPDLASILTPGRSYHKRLVQLTLDPLLCVFCPIHVPDGGRWKKRKKTGPSPAGRPATTPSHGGGGPPSIVVEPFPDNKPATPSSPSVSPSPSRPPSPSPPVADEDRPSSITMFNIVFFLRPGKGDTAELVDALYANIIQKLNKALRYAQEHSDFVWRQSKRILSLKDRAREDRRRLGSLWKDLIEQSSLAASLQTLYDALIQNRIATLQLEGAFGSLNPSMQIPMPVFIPDLPPDCDQRRPDAGLWLTTSNPLVEPEAPDAPAFLDRNFALLLTEDEAAIVAELQLDQDPANRAMLEFVRLCKPTVSFYKVAQTTVLSPGQVRRYAKHFIFWRRAMAVPPLHVRDAYILSPNCDLARLPHAAVEWQQLFPPAPPLISFLADLSRAPRPFKHYAGPKKANHRPMYLVMLAWLLRGGWVTQLCTFAYVVVWPEILYEVEYQLEAEEVRRQAECPSPLPQLPLRPPSPPQGNVGGGGGGGAEVVAPASEVEQAAERARLERRREKTRREAVERATVHVRKAFPAATENPALNGASHLAGLSAHLILDAGRATGKETLYLDAIGRRFRDPAVAAAWPRFRRYFNGRCALERIALQEDLKRKDVWSLLKVMNDHLLCVRHW